MFETFFSVICCCWHDLLRWYRSLSVGVKSELPLVFRCSVLITAGYWSFHQLTLRH